MVITTFDNNYCQQRLSLTTRRKTSSEVVSNIENVLWGVFTVFFGCFLKEVPKVNSVSLFTFEIETIIV